MLLFAANSSPLHPAFIAACHRGGMETPEPPRIASPAQRRFFLSLKVGGIVLLILALHLPLALTHGVLRERRGYQREASAEIASTWGRAQVLAGPVLAVPYEYRAKVMRTRLAGERAVQVEETDLVSGTAFFLPEEFNLRGRLDPEVRRRGIYETAVYAAPLRAAVVFRPDFAAAGFAAERIHWSRARVLFGVSDLTGLRSVGPLRAGGTESGFESTGGNAGELLPLAAVVRGLEPGVPWSAEFDLVVQGSERLEVVPVGRTTGVELVSPWTDPSFTGAALPAAREVGGSGFRAQWTSSHVSRKFGQAWTARALEAEAVRKLFGESAFGVRLARPVDNYGVAERAQKYGVLFFVLVFAVFFLFETLAGLRIHPLQYALVGAALCLFFLGFLALSEFLPVGTAYAWAAAACTGLVAGYAWSVLRAGRRALAVAAGLGATYAYLYFVLKSQDYALLAGTGALFAMLGTVMFLTRRLNWYGEAAGH